MDTEQIKGGLAEEGGKDLSDFDPEQLIKAIKVEKEHTPDIEKQLEIGMDHLTEDPEYYDDPMFDKEVKGKITVKEAHYLGKRYALAELEKTAKFQNPIPKIKKFFNRSNPEGQSFSARAGSYTGGDAVKAVVDDAEDAVFKFRKGLENDIGALGNKARSEVDKTGTHAAKNIGKLGLGAGVGLAGAIGIPYATYKGIQTAFDGKKSKGK